MTDEPMSNDQTSDDRADDDRADDDRAEEVWTYAGRRVFKGKRFYAWQDPHRRERYYAKLPAITIGGRYTVTVARDGAQVSVYGEAHYTGGQVDEQTRREMEALDIAAAAHLAAQARDRNDARRKALDDAIQTGVHLPDLVLIGNHGRAAMLQSAAREAGYPQRTVTPALTRFSRVYVVQLGGDPDAGTVTLGTRDRREVTVKLPIDVRYRILPPTRVERMLARVEADYPLGSLTAALAEALSAVLHVCDRQHVTGQTGVAVRTVAEALAPPLNAFLQPWCDDQTDPIS